MNTPFFIARRYLFSKKSRNVINIISIVSVVGLLISTAALVIVLSVFNGIEELVIELNSTFTQDITIKSKQTKSFDRNYIPRDIYQTDGLVNYSEVIEEIAILKNEEQFIIGTVKGVEPSFLEMSRMQQNLLDGASAIEDDFGPLALIGVGALQNLGAVIFNEPGFMETCTVYAPNRKKKLKRNSIDQFTTSQIPLVGTFSFNNQIDAEYIVVPIDYAAKILNYENEITAVEMDFEDHIDLEDKKAELEAILGPSFEVKTTFEQNELIYQTSKSEKWVVTLLLAFIFFLATFNMIASITMLVIEKKKNLITLHAMGARKKQLHNIFFFEGMLINIIGVFAGLAIGYLVCFLQDSVGLIPMENSVVPYFPVRFKFSDLMLILGICMFFGTLSSYFPSKFLIKRILK